MFLLKEQFVKLSGRSDVKSLFMAKIRKIRVQMIAVEESLGGRWQYYKNLF